MPEIDVSSDIDRVLSEVGDFFRDQVPFVTMQALNDTAFDIRRRIVESTWPNSITMRNKVFPGRVFRVQQKATKALLEAIVGEDGKYEFIERLAAGGTKRPRGNWLAVPVGDPRRTKAGGIASSYKPRMLKGSFIREMKNSKGKVILTRNRDGTATVRYLLIKQAEIHSMFRFEQDALETATRVFSGHWMNRLGGVIARSVFT